MLNETPMLFPMAPAEFWKQIRSTIEEVVNEKINQPFQPLSKDHLPEKALLKLSDVCAVFQVSKPTLYDWLRQNKIKSFKIKSRRYFLRADIEAMIRNHETVAVQVKD
ncbi:MAG TPA: helix-turn-helix domain-containing protein [Parafilimonas sp.]|nr:helix-turn-helix domain-containing protein [Parafilimonas sp.]